MQPSDRAYHILGALQSYAAHPEDQHIEVEDNQVRAKPGKKDPKIVETVANLSRIIRETEFEVSFNFRELKQDIDILRNNHKGWFGENRGVKAAFENLVGLVNEKEAEAKLYLWESSLDHASFEQVLKLVTRQPENTLLKMDKNFVAKLADTPEKKATLLTNLAAVIRPAHTEKMMSIFSPLDDTLQKVVFDLLSQKETKPRDFHTRTTFSLSDNTHGYPIRCSPRLFQTPYGRPRIFQSLGSFGNGALAIPFDRFESVTKEKKLEILLKGLNSSKDYLHFEEASLILEQIKSMKFSNSLEEADRFALFLALARLAPLTTLTNIGVFNISRRFLDSHIEELGEIYRQAYANPPDEELLDHNRDSYYGYDSSTREHNAYYRGALADAASRITGNWGVYDFRAAIENKNIMQNRQEIVAAQTARREAEQRAELEKQAHALKEAQNFLQNEVDKFKPIRADDVNSMEAITARIEYERELCANIESISRHFNNIILYGTDSDIELAREKAPIILEGISPLIREGEHLILVRQIHVDGSVVTNSIPKGTMYSDLWFRLRDLRGELSRLYPR